MIFWLKGSQMSFINEPRCVSVEMGSHVFDLELQIGLGPLGRALEGHVLQEVGNAVVLSSLVPEIKQRLLKSSFFRLLIETVN